MQLSDARRDRCMEASTWVPEWATNHRNQVEKREAKKNRQNNVDQKQSEANMHVPRGMVLTSVSHGE